MIFLSLIVALAFVQWWGSGGPVQRDGWFNHWLDRLWAWSLSPRAPLLYLSLALAVPCLALWAVTYWVAYWWSENWLFFVYVPVLLYCFGRGDFSAQVKEYLATSQRDDSVSAGHKLDQLLGAIPVPKEEVAGDWAAMHDEALKVISYRGFERLFGVLFWFFLLGAPGALLYRLSVLSRERAETHGYSPGCSRAWLHLLEWPAVRVTAFSWALAGNFDGCIRHCRRCLVQFRESSMTVLHGCMRGALGAYDAEEEQAPVIEPVYSRRLVEASLRLLSRALLLWVCGLALVTLFV